VRSLSAAGSLIAPAMNTRRLQEVREGLCAALTAEGAKLVITARGGGTGSNRGRDLECQRRRSDAVAGDITTEVGRAQALAAGSQGQAARSFCCSHSYWRYAECSVV